MDLRQQRNAIVLQPVDQVHLPQRPRPVERPAKDPRHLLPQLLVRRRRRQRDLAHVVLEVEVGIVDPIRIVQAQRHRLEPPPERRQQRKPLGQHVVDVGQFEPPVRSSARIEHGERAHMPALPRRLQRQKLRIEPGQLPHLSSFSAGEGESIRAPRPRLGGRDLGGSGLVTVLATKHADRRQAGGPDNADCDSG